MYIYNVRAFGCVCLNFACCDIFTFAFLGILWQIWGTGGIPMDSWGPYGPDGAGNEPNGAMATRFGPFWIFLMFLGGYWPVKLRHWG